MMNFDLIEINFKDFFGWLVLIFRLQSFRNWFYYLCPNFLE